TLRELLDSDTCVSQKEFDSIFGAILSALSYLHRRQIYHLDVKPENIVVTHKEHVAKLIDFGFAITASNEKTLVTSKKYVAPEFSERTDDITGQTDMYAFAKTMQELAEVKSISLSKRQKQIIKSALQQDVSQRITADNALALLQKPKHRGWIVLLLLLVIVAVVALLYMNNGEKLSETQTIPDTIFVEKQTVPDVNTTTTRFETISAPVIIQVKKESNSVGNSSQATLPLTYAEASKVKYNDEDSLYVVHEVEKYRKLQSRLSAALEKGLQSIEQRMDNGEITMETYMTEMEAVGKQYVDSSNVYSEQMHRSIQKYLRERYDGNDIDTYNYYSNEFVGKLIKKEITSINNIQY
ncbi:MAG: protein kinase family protein, partial [Bacteroidales bacterium]|nr:protein kinase family protein [Bacteroidales bacterium]